MSSTAKIFLAVMLFVICFSLFVCYIVYIRKYSLDPKEIKSINIRYWKSLDIEDTEEFTLRPADHGFDTVVNLFQECPRDFSPCKWQPFFVLEITKKDNSKYGITAYKTSDPKVHFSIKGSYYVGGLKQPFVAMIQSKLKQKEEETEK